MDKKNEFRILLITVLLPSFCFSEPCDCVTTDYFASETIPFAESVTLCSDWPATVPGTGSRNIPATQVPPFIGELFLSQKSIPYVDGSVKTVSALVKGAIEDCERYQRINDEALSGSYIIVLNHWYSESPLGKLTRLGGFVISMDPDIFFQVEEDEEAKVQSFFLSGGLGTLPFVPGVTFFRPAPLYSITGSPPKYAAGAIRGSNMTLLTKSLMADIKTTLAKNGWGNVTPGMVGVGGNIYPAILKRFGKRGQVFAYYGRFKTLEEAKRYGYGLKDEIYFSKRELVPRTASALFEPDYRYGSKIFLKDEVLGNKSACEWHTDCRCSQMPYEQNDRGEAKVDEIGNFTPPAPDGPENGNPPIFKSCPDARTYFSLFEKCVQDLMKDDDVVPDPSGRIDYSDYLASKMGGTAEYKSVNPNGSLDGEGLSIDKMPKTPAYYDKKGERLNPSALDMMDPFDPNTRFFGYRYGPKSLLDWEGSVKPQYEIDPRIKTVVADMKSLFEGKIENGIAPLLSMFGIAYLPGGSSLAPSIFVNAIKRNATYNSLSLGFTLDDPSALSAQMRLLNPNDKYLPYSSARVFVMQSESGRPLALHAWDPNRDFTNDILWTPNGSMWFEVFWVYGIYKVDAMGDPKRVGALRISNIFWKNPIDRGQELVSKWMDEVSMEGGKTLSSSDLYNLDSREGHTDLKSLHERDPATFTEKSEAIAQIAFYIAVSEGLDMAMKWLFSQKDKPYIYEAAKRLENMIVVKQSAKLAYAFYKGYVEWRRLMDILREIRDSRRALERAYSRFKKSGSLLMGYFLHLDYGSIRPTNITKLYPSRAMHYFDFTTLELQNELLHFESSLHALNLSLDRFMDGPGKRTLAYLYRETQSGLARVGPQNDRERERTHAVLREAGTLPDDGSDNTSRYIRLSSITRLALEKTKNTEIKSLTASTQGLRNVLFAIQSDSRDWLTMQDYVTHNLGQSPEAFSKAYRDKDQKAVEHAFDVHPIFQNTYVDDALADKEGAP